jgi:hypothetical protein
MVNKHIMNKISEMYIYNLKIIYFKKVKYKFY